MIFRRFKQVFRFSQGEQSQSFEGGGCRISTALIPEDVPPAAFFKLIVRGRFQGIRSAQLRVLFRTEKDVEQQAFLPLHFAGPRRLTAMVKFDASIAAAWLVLEADQAEVRSVAMRRIWPPEIALRLIQEQVKTKWKAPLLLASWLSMAIWHLRKKGFSGLKEWLRLEALKNCFQVISVFSAWVEIHSELSRDDRARIAERVRQLKYRPLISIVVPVYNTEERWLRLAIESVLKQLYPNWELCLADDKSPAPHVRRILEEYQKRDSRIRAVFRKQNGHISAASNSALELARGEFICLLDHDDELAEHALYMVAEELNQHPDADLIYSDEDKIDAAGRRFCPHFKPKWNIDLFYSYNLVTHLSVFRSSLVREAGGFRAGFDGSQDYDLTLRVVEQTTPQKIRHIPHLLYHWRAIPGSVALGSGEKKYAHIAARKAIQEHLNRSGIAGRVTPTGDGSTSRVSYQLPEKLPLVSIVIGTRDRLELLSTAVEGILEETDYSPLELVVVDNQSQEPATLSYLESLKRDRRVKILRYDAPFNFSAINNLGVSQATGELVLLLNNDIKVISHQWLKEMVSIALQRGVGAVGPKLLYPDGSIQHAGVILGIGGVAGHVWSRAPRDFSGYMGRGRVVQSLSAVTGACLLVKRELFQAVGGLDEKNLPRAFNDIDLCLKIRDAGHRIVWTPYAELYHLESASRGSDELPENVARFQSECEFMKRKWGNALRQDPAYNPNLTLERGDFSLTFSPRVSKPWLLSTGEERVSSRREAFSAPQSPSPSHETPELPLDL